MPIRYFDHSAPSRACYLGLLHVFMKKGPPIAHQILTLFGTRREGDRPHRVTVHLAFGRIKTGSAEAEPRPLRNLVRSAFSLLETYSMPSPAMSHDYRGMLYFIPRIHILPPSGAPNLDRPLQPPTSSTASGSGVTTIRPCRFMGTSSRHAILAALAYHSRRTNSTACATSLRSSRHKHRGQSVEKRWGAYAAPPALLDRRSRRQLPHLDTPWAEGTRDPKPSNTRSERGEEEREGEEREGECRVLSYFLASFSFSFLCSLPSFSFSLFPSPLSLIPDLLESLFSLFFFPLLFHLSISHDALS